MQEPLSWALSVVIAAGVLGPVTGRVVPFMVPICREQLVK